MNYNESRSIRRANTQRHTHQSEGSQQRQSLNISKHQLHQTQAHDEAIEYVPALLEVVIRVHRYELRDHLGCENGSEHLEAETQSERHYTCFTIYTF